MIETIDTPLSLLAGSPYRGYSYAYPHKTAYRRLDPPVSLVEAWAAEPKNGLFLYVHVPFCDMRCGFCNLFTQSRPPADVVADYLDAFDRQLVAVGAAIGEACFSRFAIGGGTPTFLDAKQLERLFDGAERLMEREASAIPTSVETSPSTADWERLAVLRQRGVARVSLGVQSFTEAEVWASGRPQNPAAVVAAIERIRSLAFPVLNLDLIYGLPGQTVASWLASVRAALRFQPEELFLYPLYVRPLTGLGKSRRSWDDRRLSCYLEARDLLLAAGYVQASMRLFRASHAPSEPGSEGPAYCVQDDGMVGLGCGARSYTSGLHYADGYAVSQKEVGKLVEEYVVRPAAEFAIARHGFRLDEEERRRRFIAIALLQSPGLPLAEYEKRFGTSAIEEFPLLAELESLELAERRGGYLQLTPAGIERSDVIGPALDSPAVRVLMEEYECR